MESGRVVSHGTRHPGTSARFERSGRCRTEEAHHNAGSREGPGTLPLPPSRRSLRRIARALLERGSGPMCSSCAARIFSSAAPNGWAMALRFSSNWSMSVMLGIVVWTSRLRITHLSAGTWYEHGYARYSSAPGFSLGISLLILPRSMVPPGYGSLLLFQDIPAFQRNLPYLPRHVRAGIPIRRSA